MNGADFPRGRHADVHGRPAMMDLAEAARAVDGRVEGENVAFAGVTTDSRAVAAGDLFVALAGDRFDGHAYLEQAEREGAVAAIVSGPATGTVPRVRVADTRIALGRLAAHWRAGFTAPLVALTGSNGKTTVKEMLAAILASHAGSADDVLATEGNLNNDIGMPLTLLRLRPRHRYAVIEMGMNHAGEIDYLTRLARPAVALVNNAQRAHVGILGSVEAIARAKGEIYAGLGNDGIAIVNEDDPHAPDWKRLNAGRCVVTFGLAPSAQVRAESSRDQVRISVGDEAFRVALQVPGEHNVRNALAACAAAFALDVPVAAMQDGLRRFHGVPGRLQRRRAAAGGWVIDDSYNANPESMKAALMVLAAEPGRRVFVMGDMGELGDASPGLHAEVGDFARSRGIDALFALGEASRAAVEAFGENGRHFADVAAITAAARAEAQAGATVLVKGSRFMQMERVADALAGKGA